MGDFGDILKRGQKMFKTKSSDGKHSRCEECNKMAPLYKYIDKEEQEWKLCEDCITIFIKEEE